MLTISPPRHTPLIALPQQSKGGWYHVENVWDVHYLGGGLSTIQSSDTKAERNVERAEASATGQRFRVWRGFTWGSEFREWAKVLGLGIRDLIPVRTDAR